MSRYTGARANEVFAGNMEAKNGVPEYLRGLTTARLGEQALPSSHSYQSVSCR